MVLLLSYYIKFLNMSRKSASPDNSLYEYNGQTAPRIPNVRVRDNNLVITYFDVNDFDPNSNKCDKKSFSIPINRTSKRGLDEAIEGANKFYENSNTKFQRVGDCRKAYYEKGRAEDENNIPQERETDSAKGCSSYAIPKSSSSSYAIPKSSNLNSDQTSSNNLHYDIRSSSSSGERGNVENIFEEKKTATEDLTEAESNEFNNIFNINQIEAIENKHQNKSENLIGNVGII